MCGALIPFYDSAGPQGRVDEFSVCFEIIIITKKKKKNMKNKNKN